IECDKVVLNDEEIAYQAVTKFLEDGRKRVALVTTENYFNVSEKRAKGYRRALEDHKIPFDENRILVLPPTDIDESTVEAFFKDEDIDAVLCVNELFAIHCMGVVRKMGRKVPENISFIGFTDGFLSRYSIPTLTVVAQHGERMGEIAAEMLIARVESEFREYGEEVYRTEIIEATLLERGSTVNGFA
ncbi:MAG: substrate-binding domain-containing protein, partial [Pricia sp.]